MSHTLDLVTAPATEPVTTAEAKAHMRVTGSDDDTYIDALVVAARTHAETITRRAFITQTWDLYQDRFEGNEIHLPNAPLISVTTVKYIDVDGVLQTFTSDDYTVHAFSSAPGEIELDLDKVWPVTKSVDNAVVTQFVAGYGAAADIPQPIKQAMLMMIAHWYENRETTIVGATIMEVPQASRMLLAPYRVTGF